MKFGLGEKRPLFMPPSQGLGLGCAEMLWAKGVRVLLTGRSADKLAETANVIPVGWYVRVAKFTSVCAFLRPPKQAMSPWG
jgi:NAD(P)-dependent dehydrogenase (short-subunit alcohol dehydrogenase family)